MKRETANFGRLNMVVLMGIRVETVREIRTHHPDCALEPYLTDPPLFDSIVRNVIDASVMVVD